MGYRLAEELIQSAELRGICMDGVRGALHQHRLATRRRSEIPERVPANREWTAREALRSILTAKPVDAIRAAKFQEELRRIQTQNLEHDRLQREVNAAIEQARLGVVKASRAVLERALQVIAAELDADVAAAPPYCLEFPEGLSDRIPPLVELGNWIHEQITHTLPLQNNNGQQIYAAPLLSRVRPEFRDAIAVRSRIGRGPAVPAGWAQAAV